MRIEILTIVFGAFLFVSLPAHASYSDAQEAPCQNFTVTSELTDCLSKAAAETDKELNEVYRRVRGVLGKEDQLRLVAAQRAWLSYRDQTCEASSKLYGNGSAGLPALPACLQFVTRHRILDLRNTYWWRVEKFED